MSVEVVELEKLLTRVSRWNPAKAAPDEDFEYIDLSSVDKDQKAITSTTTYVGASAPSRAQQLVQRDDVLVSTVRPNLNGVAQVPDSMGGATASTGYCVLRANPQRLDARYLFHWVKTSTFVNSMVQVATGANYPAVSDKDVKASKIPLPPLEQQKRIAAILDKADELRAKRRSAIAKLDDLLKSVFLELFGDPVTNPKNWPVKELADVLVSPPQNGAYYPREQYSTNPSEGTEMVHMSDVFYGVVRRGALKRVNTSNSDTAKYGLTSKDLLIARRSLNYEGAAKPCLIPKSNEPLLFESSLIRVTPDQEMVSSLFLYYYLANEVVRQAFVYPRITGATISGINQDALKKINVIVPPTKLQNSFHKIADRLDVQKRIMKQHMVITSSLFSALQARAFSGDLTPDILQEVEAVAAEAVSKG